MTTTPLSEDEQACFAQVHARFENEGKTHFKVSVCQGEKVLAGPKSMPIEETRKMTGKCGLGKKFGVSIGNGLDAHCVLVANPDVLLRWVRDYQPD